MGGTDYETAVAFIEAWVPSDVPPVLPPETVETVLQRARVRDSEGRWIGDDGYVDTYLPHLAAADLLDMKAARLTGGTVVSWSSEGSSVSRQGGWGADDFRRAARELRARGTGGVTVIDLGAGRHGPVPRSEFRGVTPDDDRIPGVWRFGGYAR